MESLFVLGLNAVSGYDEGRLDRGSNVTKGLDAGSNIVKGLDARSNVAKGLDAWT